MHIKIKHFLSGGVAMLFAAAPAPGMAEGDKPDIALVDSSDFQYFNEMYPIARIQKIRGEGR